MKSKQLELKICLDTNAIFTGSSSDLLKTEVRELIEDCKKHKDVAISWHIPSIVIEERRYQMMTRAADILPQLEKLYRLLGHNLGISLDTLAERVDAAITKALADQDLIRIDVDYAKVDWSGLVSAAVRRIAPFEAGEKEKGFRDSIVLESFLQLVQDSPTAPSRCLVALVTGDSLLLEAAKQKGAHTSNVRLLASLDEARGLINTVVAAVDEDFVSSIAPSATSTFWKKGENDSCYYAWKVRDSISNSFEKQLTELPPAATRRENGTWYIHKPRFLKKNGRRVYWATKIDVAAQAFQPSTDWSVALSSRQSLADLLKLNQPALKNPEPLAAENPAFTSGGTVPLGPSDTLMTEGYSQFEVQWSVLVKTNRQLHKPELEGIDFVENKWGEKAG